MVEGLVEDFLSVSKNGDDLVHLSLFLDPWNHFLGVDPCAFLDLDSYDSVKDFINLVKFENGKQPKSFDVLELTSDASQFDDGSLDKPQNLFLLVFKLIFDDENKAVQVV